MQNRLQIELIDKIEKHNARFLCETSIHNYYRAYKRLQGLVDCKNSNIHKDIKKILTTDNKVKSMAVVFSSLGGGHNVSNALIFDISQMTDIDLINSKLSTIAISPHNDIMGRSYGSFGFLVDIIHGNDLIVKNNDPYWVIGKITKNGEITDTLMAICKNEVFEYCKAANGKPELILAEMSLGFSILLKWDVLSKKYLEIVRFNNDGVIQ